MTNQIKTIRIRTVLAGLALALLGALTLFALPASAGVAEASAKTERKCANDGAVKDAGNNPGLVADCAVLLDIKKNLEGEDGRKLNWSSSLPMCDWDGIDGNGGQINRWSGGYWSLGPPNRVTGIDVSGYGLKGKIPKRLGKLTELRVLQMSHQDLQGSIPKELGNLSELMRLDLYKNELSGKIPKSLGKLSELRELYLFGNNLTGEIPKQLGKLSNLTVLSLEHNNLTGEIPKQLGKLSNLRRMLLRQNQLTGEIPKQLGKLRKLELLELQFNNLTGCMPRSLEHIENIRLSYGGGGWSKYRTMGKPREAEYLLARCD